MYNKSPVVIGGIGGSGTRVIAEFIKNIGYSIGDDLNVSFDNLTFTLLFKRLSILLKTKQEIQEIINLFDKIMHNKNLSEKEYALINEASIECFKSHEKNWLKERHEAIKIHTVSSENWGWKEPTSHIILEQLNDFFPKLKYIHVVRSGLDMAYSKNQIQLKLWGKNMLSNNETNITPTNSLKYWCKMHQRVRKIIKENNIDACIIDFDELSKNSSCEREKIMKFLELDTLDELDKLIKEPLTINRYKKHDIEKLDIEDVKYAKSFFKKDNF